MALNEYDSQEAFSRLYFSYNRNSVIQDLFLPEEEFAFIDFVFIFLCSTSDPMTITALPHDGASDISNPFASFGSSTKIPTHIISKLSFYLKCCILGCELKYLLTRKERSIIDFLLDYRNAQSLPHNMQELIVRLALTTFNADNMIQNQNIVLDESHVVLEPDIMNFFYQVATPALGQKKIMVCDPHWIEEYYIHPLSTLVQQETFDISQQYLYREGEEGIGDAIPPTTPSTSGVSVNVASSQWTACAGQAEEIIPIACESSIIDMSN